MSNPPDFTFPTYTALLEAGLDADYEFLTVAEYLEQLGDARSVEGQSVETQSVKAQSIEEQPVADQSREKADTPSTRTDGTGLPDRFILLRHDVDRKLRSALAMARLEAEFGVQGTYYIRTIDKTFKPDIIRRIAELGHEVGYHYEDLDRADGDSDAALDSFATELERLRSIVDVETVCMHGNPLSPYDNRTIWEFGDITDFGLLGEAYLSVDFTDVTYFSDTGRTWRDDGRKIKDHALGEHNKQIQIDTTHELIQLVRDQKIDRPYLLTHPNRWARNYPELVVEHTKDTAINVVKRGINLLP